MRSSRLLSMILILQTRGRATAPELAERLEVSRRTVLRDVEALSAMGVPVYTERGHGGGIVLLPGSRLDLSRLEPPEVEALALSGLDREQRERLGVEAAHGTARRKMAARTGPAGLPLARLVLVESGGWLEGPQDAGTVPADLVPALRRGSRLRLRYRRSGQEQEEQLVADPYGLVAKAGRWYLVADAAPGATPRLLALTRLSAHEELPETAHRRDGEDLASVWAALRDRFGTEAQVEVRVRLAASRIDLARRILGSRIRELGPAEDGWCEARVVYEDVRGVRQLLQFGEHVEVVGPPEARALVAAAAEDLSRRHR